MVSQVEQLRRWAATQADQYREGRDRPLRGYLGAMGVYAGLVGTAAAWARALGRRSPERVTPWDVAPLGRSDVDQ